MSVPPDDASEIVESEVESLFVPLSHLEPIGRSFSGLHFPGFLLTTYTVCRIVCVTHNTAHGRWL